MDFPEEHGNYGRGSSTCQMSRYGVTHSSLFKNFPAKNIFLSSKAWGTQALLSIFLLPPFQWWDRRKVEGEKVKVRKRVNVFHFFFIIIKKNQVIYIEKFMDFRFSSKKGLFFFFFGSAYGRYPCWGFFGVFFLLLLCSQDPALHCLQRVAHWDQWLTGTSARILAHSSATIVSYISSCYKCLGGSSPGLGSARVPPRNYMRTDFQSK